MKKLIVSATIVSLILLGLIAYYPNLSFLYLIKSRYSVTKTPWAYIEPIDRNIGIPNSDFNSTQTFSFNGLKFRVPWKQLRTNKKLETGLFLSFYEDKNKGIFISSSEISMNNIREKLLSEYPSDSKAIKTLLGNDLFKSEYDLYNQCLNASPSLINIFTPKRELGKIFVLLMLKNILTRYDVKIFRFETKYLKGFQFGNLKLTTKLK